MRAIIEGTPSELREFFAGKTKVDLAPQGRLDAETVARDLPRVTTNAQKALEFICRHAPRVGFDAVAEHLGVTTKVLSGSMSSVYNQAPTIGRALDRDYSARVYLIDAEDAKILLDWFDRQ